MLLWLSDGPAHHRYAVSYLSLKRAHLAPTPMTRAPYVLKRFGPMSGVSLLLAWDGKWRTPVRVGCCQSSLLCEDDLSPGVLTADLSALRNLFIAVVDGVMSKS